MFYYDLKGPALAAYRESLKEATSRFQRETRCTPQETIARPVRPEDLGFASSVWRFTNITVANSSTPVISDLTIARNTFIVLNGVFFSTSSAQMTQQLQINRKGTIARIWNIQGVQLYQDSRAFVDDPIILDQSTLFTLQVHATATGTENFGLLGTVIEKRGVVMSP